MSGQLILARPNLTKTTMTVHLLSLRETEHNLPERWMLSSSQFLVRPILMNHNDFYVDKFNPRFYTYASDQPLMDRGWCGNVEQKLGANAAISSPREYSIPPREERSTRSRRDSIRN
jgi:hypothetical protein